MRSLSHKEKPLPSVIKMCYKRTFSMKVCIEWTVHAAKHGTHNALRNTECNKHAQYRK